MAKKAELNTKINLDSSAFQRGIAKSKKSVSTFASTLKGSLLPVLGAAGAAGAMISLGKEAMRTAKEIKQLAGVSGVGVEEFQKLAFAAKTVNIEQEKLADIFKDTSDKMGDFMQVGSGPMVDFFEKIAPMVGATKEEFVGLSGADALQKYFNFLEKANLPHADMVFYMEAIASDATMLIPLLENGGEAFKTLGDGAEAAGNVMKKEVVDSLTEAQNALDRLQKKATIVAGNLVSVFLPAKDKFKEMAKEQLIAAKQLEGETKVQFGMSNAVVVKDQQAIIRNREKINKLAEELQATEEKTEADAKTANDLANAKLKIVKDEAEAADELAKNYEKNFFIAKELEVLKLQAAGDTAQADALQKEIELAKSALELMKKHNISREEAIELTNDLLQQNKENEDQIAFRENSLADIQKKELLLLKLQSDGDTKGASALKRRIEMAKFALELMEKHNISREEAVELTKKLHPETKKVTEEDEDQVTLKNKKLALLQAEAAQDDELINEAQKQLNLEQSIQDIMHSTNVDRQTAINLAKELSAVDAGADTNQSGFVTAKEQRAEESRQRKLAQERRKREREERSAEVGEDEKQRKKLRDQRMTKREFFAGIYTKGREIEVPEVEVPEVEVSASLNIEAPEVPDVEVLASLNIQTPEVPEVEVPAIAEQRISGREIENGKISGTEANMFPSGETAPSTKTQENAVVEINKQTANNTKEILLEIQKNP